VNSATPSDRADATVIAKAIADPESPRGMGTTLTMAYKRGAPDWSVHAATPTAAIAARRQIAGKVTDDHTLVKHHGEGRERLTPEADPATSSQQRRTNVIGPSQGVHTRVHAWGGDGGRASSCFVASPRSSTRPRSPRS